MQLKKLKMIIISIIVIIIIISIIIAIMRISLNKNEIDGEIEKRVREEREQYIDIMENPIYLKQGQSPDKVRNPSVFFSIDASIQKYIGYVVNKDNEAILNILDKQYIAENNINKDNLEIYHVNPEEAINDMESATEHICRVNIKKGMPLIFLTNTIYYDNYNRTLPEGMELNDLVLLDNSKFEFLKKRDSFFRMNRETEKFEYENCEIYVKEYNLKLKHKKEGKNDK
ncbi:MAG TPA: hypothetical protein DCE23_02540 [Firmicutes bacterium]|nr:hypothetical protein [Bacillota bacterium]